MTRTAAHLALCAILGCLTSIAVAWGFAWPGHPGAAPSRVAPIAWPDAHEFMFFSEMERSKGAAAFQLRRSRGNVDAGRVQRRLSGEEINAEVATLVAEPNQTCHPPVGDFNFRAEHQFGWPRLCMWGAVDTVRQGCIRSAGDNLHIWKVRTRPGTLPPYLHDTLPFQRDAREDNRYLPTGILWTGLATNTACYATAWWLILLAPAQLRTFIRKRHGQCTRCAYDLRATPPSTPCPECGNSPTLYQ